MSSSCSHSLKVSISQVIVSWEYIVIYFSCEYELQFTSPLFQKYFVSEFHRLITHCLRKLQFSLFPQSAFIFIVPGCKVGIYSISFVFSSQSSKIPIPSINLNLSVPGLLLFLMWSFSLLLMEKSCVAAEVKPRALCGAGY